MKSASRINASSLPAVIVLVLAIQAQAQPRHGMWVYGIIPRCAGTTCPCCTSTGLLDEDPNANDLLGFCGANRITELYLSLGAAARALSDPRLPNFISNLKGGGLRLEALVGCSDIADCQRGAWRTRIEQVKDYNNARADTTERFDAVHLDLEPWVGTCPAPPGECDFGWVTDLIGYYGEASSALDGSGLALAADISGVKVISDRIDAANRQALLDAATRLVLMEYEVTSVDTINERVDRFRNAVDLSGASFMIATRVQDFAASNACENGTVLKQFDERYVATSGYAGWATFKYDSGDCTCHYNDPSICPGDCCRIQP